MTDKLLASMNAVYETPELPSNVADYELLSCLKHGDGSAVYLMRKNGERFILKNAWGDRATSLKSEYDILNGGGFSFLPKALDFWADNDGAWLLREYIDGTTISNVAEKSLDEQVVVSLLIKLCGILDELHNHVPPIIHRDIKPENIVRKPDGGLAIIDVGTVREFDRTAANDTFYMGTPSTAAPEQFGFAQTDARTDVFAVGKVAAFMLSGDYRSAPAELPASMAFRRVVAKCLALDPKRRYQTAAALRTALKRVSFVKSRAFRAIRTAAVCAALLLCGAVIGVAVQPLLPDYGAVAQTPLTFQEPLIEKAVRAALVKDKREPIYAADMTDVTELCVIGNAVYPSNDTGQAQKPLWWGVNGDPRYRGDIESLDDLSQCANLRLLTLVGQNISDVSPLAGLPIERLDLSENPALSDFAPIADIAALYQLDATSTALSDLTFVKSLTGLRQLQIGNLQNVTSLEPMRGLALNDIVTTYSPVTDFSPLFDMPLMAVDLGGMTQADLERLCEIKTVTGVGLWYGDGITDLSPLKNLPDLIAVRIVDTEVADLTPLFELPALEVVESDAHKLGRIREIAEYPPFELKIFP